jgi:hypothetical protein|tara:strand:- start:349 stop:1101 length:753 start_codon:yes stop_codon:yes gene_type:complete
MAEHKFPTEVIDLPSQGKLYPKDSPLAEGKLELKYMTTREEDILMSENLIKKGVVIDKLLDSLIVTPNVKQTDLILGDKNAVLVAARILAYGPEYTTEINNPNDVNKKIEHTFDLSQCPFKELSDDIKYDGNSFEFTTPVGKNKLKFKILTGADEALMNKDIEQSKKYGYETTISTRLRYSVIEVDGDNKLETITSFTQNMLARDSIALRNQILKVSPDIDMTSEIEIGGETVSVSIPLSVEFFWPSSIE